MAVQIINFYKLFKWNAGDYIRVIVKVNVDPSAVADTGYIQEGKTLTVANSGSAVAGTTTESNTGDITDNDTDANNDSLTVTHIQHSGAGSSTSVTNVTYNHGSATSVNGTYGTLTIGSDGSYQYVASSDINNLDAGEANVTDVFTYTVSDGNGGTDTETLTINVIPSQDLTARNDTGTVNEDAELDVDDGDDLTPVTAASYSDSDSLTIAGSDSSPATTQSHFEDLIFNDDGTKMYTLGYASSVSGKNIFQYTLSIPFDVSTASVSSDDHITVGGSTENNEAIRFNNDGTKLFVLNDATSGGQSSRMYQYTLSTAYDITSTVTAGNTFTLGDYADNFRAFLFNDDGSKMFVSKTGSINEYTLNTPFDTSIASKTTAAWWSSNNSYGISNYGSSSSITGMQYNNDGTKLFTVHQQSTVGHTAKIVEWSLSTAYDPMTASTNADFNDTSTYFETGEATSSSDGIPNKFITFNNDGTKFFSFNHTHETGSSSSQKIKEWNLASPFNLVNVSGEHSGDVINTSSTDNYDTDPDSDTLTVTTYSHTSATDEDGGSISSTSSTGTAGTNNVTGYYGTLDLEGDGSYTYTADLTATQALDPGDTVTDVFTYTVDDGNGETDTATITITVNGMNDAPTAVADTDSVDAGSTVTDEDGEGTLVSNDTDPDASSSLYVTKITGNGNTSNVTYNSTKTSNAATIVGAKGTLTFGSDGSYSYAANSDATPGDDVFTYTLSDGTATHDATLTITINNTAPSATVDTGYIQEGKTLTVANDASANDADSSSNNNDATGDHTGGILGNDTDANGDSLTITTYTHTSSAGQGGANTTPGFPANGTAGTDSVAGTYGTLDLEANGSYTYTANSNITNLDVDDETFTDVFTYTVSDGNGGTATATITITIEASGDVTARNDTGTILEDGTLTVSDGAGANSSGGVTDDGQTADISNEETSVSGLSFNNDGTKMFVSGGQSDKVHEYSLSTAFDVSTKSATANESYSDISSYDWTRGHTWNANGTKLFIIDNEEGTHQKILEHTVQTAFDLSSTVTRTNAYDLVAPSGGSIPTRPKGITFNSDGTKMYIADHQTDKIHQFTLSVGYNLASTVANSGTLDVSSQNDSPYGVEFSQDGSKVFVVGNGTQGDAVYQYTLNTAWDITSTATYNGSFDLSSQDSVPADIRFNNDGTKMFIAGSNGNEIEEYTLSTPFEITSISGNHDGDVLVDDSDADSDALTVTDYSHTSATNESGGSASSGTGSSGTAGSDAVTGYYGTLTLAANGSYTYAATATVTDALDPGDVVTDVFTYTASDGNGETDTATITITVIGVNDTPTASNGTVNINENNQASTAGDRTPSNITKVFAASDFNFADDDTSGSLSKVKITTLESAGDLEYNNGSSWVDVTEDQEITASDISNNKLRFTPAANSESNPTFGFKVHDGTDYSSSAYTMTISVNAAPNVTDTTVAGTVAAGATTSSADIHTIVADSDDDDSVLVVTGVASGNESSNNTIITNNTGVGSAVSGTYGSLNIAANGTYTYTASCNK